MPKRTDIKNILIIGSGPIVIGQGAEFDYSGTQACKALREEGYSVVLINSNPATIMTDPDMADRTYIEPITPEFIEKILIRERDDGRPVHALLPTLGGQTGLNCAMECHERGILARHNVEMIGATPEAIHKAEDRTAFKETMIAIGLDVPRSGVAHTWDEAKAILDRIKLPCCIRPAYTLGGEGGGFCRTLEEFETIARRGLAASRVSEILIEESLYGWKEFELEVMRDRADNVVIICGIENLDPMGVHTGDSITVAPIQTLTDKEYQLMRDSAIAIIRAIGVETGGCNIQFAVEPSTGRQCVIEMNPRVSRSSALASKATGYPIARIAAKLAVGYTLDELPNDITKTTPASFEPTIDYVVVKIPRWTFEKFPDCDETLTTQMKSVGEAMAIGRTFKEAFQKCIRSMEIQRCGFGLDDNDAWLKATQKSHETIPISSGQAPPRSHEGIRTQTEPRPSGSGCQNRERERVVSLPPYQGGTQGGHQSPNHPIAKSPNDNWQSTIDNSELPLGGATATEAPPDTEEEHAKSWPIPDPVLRDKLARPSQGRPYYVRYAFKMGWSIDQVHELTRIDPWFLDQMRQLVEEENELTSVVGAAGSLSASVLFGADQARRRAKSLGYTDLQLAAATRRTPAEVAAFARQAGLRPTYKLVDTCAAEFEARTPYYYSSHEAPAFNAIAAHNASDDEIRVTDKPKVVILGGGPNRIGQGIEFDYCCCHASFAARQAGFESVMVNSNPETVSTDFDTSDLLFFEPLTHEDVLNIVERLNGVQRELPTVDCQSPNRDSQSAIDNRQSAFAGKPVAYASGSDADHSTFRIPHSAFRERDPNGGRVRGVIVQFGGQTPLNLAQGLKDAGVPILGTQPEMIHLAEDREQFQQVLRELSLLQPPSGIARTPAEARAVAKRVGYPVLVRPSYVLGGRGMKICNNQRDLDDFLDAALAASDRRGADLDNPILIDKFLVDAIEVDVDAVADFGRPLPLGGEGRVRGAGHQRLTDQPSPRPSPCEGEGVRPLAPGMPHGCEHDDPPPPMCMVAGIMEHIEEAGIHSGDSTAVIPPFSLGRVVIEELFRSTKRLAKRLQVCGAMNVQYAILNRTVYVLEVNPRASRTLPFVAKATGVPWAQIATNVMLGDPLETVLARHGVAKTPWPDHTAIKAPVFPFHKFSGVDVILGPEMRSTGEVMAIAPTFGQAFAKAQIATGLSLPVSGNALVSVCDPDKPRIVSIARELYDLGFAIFSTVGTRSILEEAGIPATLVSKSQDTHGAPFLLDLILEGALHLLINTPIRTGPASAEGRWRAAATARHIPLITTIAGARAAVSAIRALSKSEDSDEPIPLDVRCLQAYFHQRT